MSAHLHLQDKRDLGRLHLKHVLLCSQHNTLFVPVADNWHEVDATVWNDL